MGQGIISKIARFIGLILQFGLLVFAQIVVIFFIMMIFYCRGELTGCETSPGQTLAGNIIQILLIISNLIYFISKIFGSVPKIVKTFSLISIFSLLILFFIFGIIL